MSKPSKANLERAVERLKSEVRTQNETLAELKAKLNEAQRDLLALEHDFCVGDVVERRGKRWRLSRINFYMTDVVEFFGHLQLKNGSFRDYETWVGIGTEDMTLVEKGQ